MDRYFKANAVLSVFSKNYMELKKGLPIPPSEMGVINIITGTPGPHTSVMLAGLLGVSKPMITAHIRSLESKGYITKMPSTQDKRAFYIVPTEKAKALAERARIEQNGHLDRLVTEMGQEEFDIFIRLAEMANRILGNEGV